jgi:hypothetical protein
MAGTPAQNGNNEAGNNDSSRKTVALAGWATPNTVDAKGGTRKGKGQVQLCHQARLAEWPTPRASDGEKNVRTQVGVEAEIRRKGAPQDLRTAAAIATWATPAASEAGGTPEQFLKRKQRAKDGGASLGVSLTSLSLQAQLTSGQIESGSSAPTANGGQLNPEHSRWLMGYPKDWLNVAPPAMPSSRRSRKS